LVEIAVQQTRVPEGSDEILEEFLSFLKPSTASVYRITFQKHFLPYLKTVQFHGEEIPNLRVMLDLISADQARPVREKENVGRALFKGFCDYLKAEGMAPKSIVNRIGAVQSLCKFKELSVSTKYIQTPEPVAQTISFAWNIQWFEIQNAYLKHADYRALAACTFQSGSGIGDVLVRPYSLIQKGYEAQLENIAKQVAQLEFSKTYTLSPEFPVKSVIFRAVRGKTGVEHRTGYGPESLVLLKRHFDEQYGENGAPKPEAPIFDMQRRPIDEMFAVRAKTLIGEWPYRNPMGIHGFRKFFRKRMVKEGKCPSEYAEYFMAHQLKGDMRKTYSEMDDTEWLQIYREYAESKLQPTGEYVPGFLSFRILPLEVAQKEFKKLMATPTISP
jgi:hypothetical protein